MSTLDTTVSMIQKCTEDVLKNYKFPEGSTKAAKAKKPVKRWRN